MQIAVVTGAAAGNGKSIATGLARAGARVVLADKDKAGAVAAAKEIADEGYDAIGFGLDVSHKGSCDDLAAAVADTYGDTSILVNNAGIVQRVGIAEENFLESAERQYSVNALGVVHMVRSLLPALQRTKGRIVNIGSIASVQATTGGIGYGMSKGAVLLATKTLAVELADHGIRVNAIAPGIIETAMTVPTRANPEKAKGYTDRIPLKRFGQPDELVGPVLFLVSDQSSYVNGILLPVDGGYLAG
ncbi:3-oxoacyl-ACP reductase [Rhizobium sp. Root1204]|nr:3-oxoacyl-ACP reductase [Rhizobium sp. Root1204]